MLIEFNERNGATSLLIAASQGDDSCMETLLLANATPDPHHSVATSPLLAAVTGGHSSCAATLLSFGASSDRSDEGTGAFPLLAASGSGSASRRTFAVERELIQTRPAPKQASLRSYLQQRRVSWILCNASCHTARRSTRRTIRESLHSCWLPRTGTMPAYVTCSKAEQAPFKKPKNLVHSRSCRHLRMDT